MRSRAVAGGFLVRLDRGEEVIETVTAFAARRKIACAFLQGIGAVEKAEIGHFDLVRKTYRRRAVSPVAEVVGLSGNISLLNGRPFIHAHIILAGSDHEVTGGHLFSATVAITLELYVRVIRGRLVRQHDPKTGFNFWHI